jgi:hypothetical protein
MINKYMIINNQLPHNDTILITIYLIIKKLKEYLLQFKLTIPYKINH